MSNATVYAQLLEQAEKSPDGPALLIGGQEWSRQSLCECVRSVAAGLHALGLERGDRVAIIADNRFESMAGWLGANAAGLIDVPINSESRGAHLRYLIHDAMPRVLIGTSGYLRKLTPLLEAPPERVVVIDPDDGEPPFGPAVAQLSFAELLELGRDGTVPPPREDEIATIIYTSGTTGPSKGVLLPQPYYVTWAGRGIASTGMQAGHTCYTPQPLFHADARSYVVGSLISGGRVAVGERFSVSRFWDEIRAAGASYFSYLGTMLSMLYAAPPREDDSGQPAVVGIGGAAPADIHLDFERRFGVRLIEMYGMTESLGITMNTLEDSRVGSVGKPVPELEVQLVDDQDRPVAAGEVGELVLRPRQPNIVMAGYRGKPEATVKVWRNLWLHTGDRLRADDDGFLYYVGRLKDSIRRRGENVSAWEVEQALCKHPDVLEAGVIGVPSQLGEEDVAALVVSREGREVDPKDLHVFAGADLPRFAVPRYIEVIDALPKTPTERVNKDAVRERGLTEAAWDAEAADQV